jgi:dihydrofolate reductase
MTKVRVHNFSISVDGYGAGPDQTLDVPLGVGGESLHEWVFATPGGRRMLGREVADDEQGGLDDEIWQRGDDNIGASILGRNMFGPIRGEWPDDEWKGWWGDEPPYHTPVFVLTHHARQPVEMQGGTTFHFVTDGIEAALEQARAAAAGADVRIGGGVSTIQQYLVAGAIDELHIAISPVLLGGGERLFDVPPGTMDRYRDVTMVPSDAVAHVFIRKTG